MRNEDLRKRITLIQEKAKSILNRIELSKEKVSDNNIDENEKVISENYKIIEEQKFIIEELSEIKKEKYEKFTSELLGEMNYDTIFDLTKDKEISFDKKHPYFNNIKFIKDLMQYYIEVEEYEECSYLHSLV